MNRRKDIKIEIDNYVKGNYSKNIASELLRRDGFSESEINEHTHKLDIVEKNISMSYMFVPGFLFIIVSAIFLLTIGTSSEQNSYSTISLIGSFLTLPLIYFYYKGEKFSILFTGFAIICVIFYFIVGIFSPQTSLVNTLISIIFLTQMLFSVKNYYKSIKL